MLQSFIANTFLKLLEHIEHGSMEVITPEGKTYHFNGKHPGPHGQLVIHDWQVISNLRSKGDIGFAEDYRDGKWDSQDPANFMQVALLNEHLLEPYIYGSALSRAVARMFRFGSINSLKGSKRNIKAHYDLGNDFYKLWLDPTMTYSSGIFGKKDEGLIPAQYNKYDRIIERLNPTGNVLEVGCGWGGFAERAANQNDYTIKGITLSQQQHHYATKRLNGSAAIALEDYRKQEGKYDNIVSIEMFEAVGEQYWPTYFQKLASLLQQKGKAVIQTITIDEKYFESYRTGSDAIRNFIFPGGMLPSPTRFAHEAQNAGLKVTDRYDFGTDYATTLEHWQTNFNAKHQEIKQLGFNNEFMRLWQFYLASCIASFRVQRTNVMQVELQHA